MNAITLSDGPQVNAAAIKAATLWPNERSLLIETENGYVRVEGEGIFGDAYKLENVRDQNGYKVLVFRHPYKTN